MNIYTWKITSIFTLASPPAPINECAVRAEYIVTASNGNKKPITSSIEGISQFVIPSDNGNLTPYDSLTEEQVISWIQSEPNLVENIQANLDGQIDAQINPPIIPINTPLPWEKK